MRIDNLFLLEDGSVAIIDYESSVKYENYVKYLNYIVRVMERYKRDRAPQIRMIVIYTADVEKADEYFQAGCLTLRLEQAFLIGIDSEGVYKEIKRKLEKGKQLSDDELMKLMILPLTYKGKDKKKQGVKQAVELAKQIEDTQKKTFVLSGILVFADKIIDADTAKYRKEIISMTQVAELLLEEGREEGRKQGIHTLIESLRSFSIPDETIIGQLIERYELTKDEASVFIGQK